MKKIIVYLTIFSLLNLAGCYYQEQMNPGNYKFDENSKLTITTRDSVYNFIGDDYYFKNDTVHGIQSVKMDRRTTYKLKVEIPVEEIATVDVERTDALATILLALGITIGVFAVIFLIGFDMKLKLDASGSGSQI
ncbi:MAG: hypothetical protein IH618_08175 [Ignavibacteriaceae bacterium]|nr:hypothetical protein [Ignavibacteriaceae bacterium]